MRFSSSRQRWSSCCCSFSSGARRCPALGAETDSGDRVIVPYLRAAGLTRLDLVVLSHEDNDHLGGALTVLESLETDALASSLPPWHTLNALVAAPRRCLAAGSWEWDG